MPPPQVPVRVLVRVALNVEPVAPVSVPAVTPHVPETALRFTLFVSPVELTLAKVPLTTPVVRFSAVAPDTLTPAPIDSVPKVVPLIAVVEPVSVTPASVMVDVPSVLSESPVVPPLIVPPLMVTLPLPSDVSETPVVAPVVLTALKVMPPEVMPLRLMPVVAAPVVTLAVLLTVTVPPVVALKPMPVVVVMLRFPLKLIVAPVLDTRLTAVLVVVRNVWVPVKVMIPDVLLPTSIPVLPTTLSLIVAPRSLVPAAAGRVRVRTLGGL